MNLSEEEAAVNAPESSDTQHARGQRRKRRFRRRQRGSPICVPTEPSGNNQRDPDSHEPLPEQQVPIGGRPDARIRGQEHVPRIGLQYNKVHPGHDDV
ncbi:hypothetical protein L596_002661 [Steinernema carpocapsae]|uniref:Uncharacterized protein n=1 Tax=Steinernema carpocapsae TaxID=34508 RepID=A0A4U8UQ65_STECR|nr:hypothetical protein L596_002661 [Steinernema carpocapsae]